MKHCWQQLLMIYLLRSNASSNAFAIGRGGTKGACVVNHFIGAVTSSIRSSNGGRHAISTAVDHYGGDCGSVASSSTTLHQTSSYSEHYHSQLHNQNTLLIQKGGYICFRLARKSDVPQIQNCNLATLPENYNSNFYVNHMRQWPDLALVAEHIPEGYDIQSDIESNGHGGDNEERITPLREYITKRRRGHHNQQQQPKKEIVGYILGKVEERPINPIRQIFPSSRVPPLYDEEDTLLQYLDGGGNMNGARVFHHQAATTAAATSNINHPRQQQRLPPRTETIGHVTSIAVHSHARRLGVASSLLQQLHYHLDQCYQAKSVGLHVRISNGAAVKLYCERLGYDVADIIPFYYGDGEDAYFMRKDLLEFDNNDDHRSNVVRGEEGRRSSSAYERRDAWVNRDARNGGSFFDNRRSLRDSLSPEERAWVNNGSGGIQYNSSSPSAAAAAASQRSSIGGHFKRSFQTFLNGGDPSRPTPPQSGSWDRPVWETGPEYLRLPRYTKIERCITGGRIEEDATGALMEHEQRVAAG